LTRAKKTDCALPAADPQMLIDSLRDAGIEIAGNAQPVFLDL
jgi:hypothetical protein